PGRSAPIVPSARQPRKLTTPRAARIMGVVYTDECIVVNGVRLHYQAWAREQYPWLAGMPQEQATEAVRWAVRENPDGRWRFKFDPAIGRAVRPSPETADAARRIWWSAWSALRCPVLLIRGAESDILSAATADEMQRRQPAMLRADVPGVGHAPTLTEPAALAALQRFYLGST